MTNTSLAIRFAVISAFGLLTLQSCNNKSGTAPVTSTVSTSRAGTGGGNNNIAYVDIDSLEEHYEYLKAKREDFKKRQGQMESELQSSFNKMQSDAAEIQKKAQSNTLSQAEYEAAQKRFGQMQQSLETRKQVLSEQLMKEQEEFNKTLKVRLDSFLTEYNKDKHYDFILSYSANGSILYANKQLNITQDVIKGMNQIGSGDDKNKK